MRVAVIGAMGQLGSALVDQLGSKAISLGRTDLDITNSTNIWNTLDHERPEIVVNCAAYNFVDKAETEREAAMLVNRRGPGFLADYCRERDLKFVHISTDYVYDGRNGQKPWTELDEASPISTYACSKHAGEQLVRTHCPRHFVVRTCGLYGRASAKGKGNFVETILRLAKERPELRIVGDQVCSPTSTLNLASALIDLMQTDAYGLYHATNSGSCSWADFATEILRYSNMPHESRSHYDGRVRCASSSAILQRSELLEADWRDQLGHAPLARCADALLVGQGIFVTNDHSLTSPGYTQVVRAVESSDGLPFVNKTIHKSLNSIPLWPFHIWRSRQQAR